MEIANLVTSPFGIGSKLILELLKRRETVYTIFQSPKDVPMYFLGKPNLKYGFIRFDQDVNIEKALPRRVENVFHLHDVYSGRFTQLFKSNTLTTLLLLEWAKNAGAKKFIYVSSGEVYGKGKHLDENSSYNPRSFYATTKYEAEILFRYYHRAFTINTVRLFFPFGKDLEQGYISNIYKSIKSNDVVDTEYNVISPTFVDDVVEPLIKIIAIKDHEVFNICGSQFEVGVLIDKIKKICGKLPKTVRMGETELYGNNEKAKKQLGYEETSLEKALEASFGPN